MIPEDSIQRNDILRFSYFSQDYIYLHPDYNNLIADLRYGTLPYDNKSLWGIEIDEKNQILMFFLKILEILMIKFMLSFGKC